MPFIKQDRRKIIDQHGPSYLDDVAPGDWCYGYYRDMVKKWKENPRWTTAHSIHKEVLYPRVFLDADQDTAKHLAWQVFFQLYVMPYELLKRDENGEIN